MWRSSVVAACLRWIRQNIAEPELIVTRTAGKGHRDKLDNHPLPALLSRPNDFWSKYDLLGAVALDAICDGNSLIWKQRAASGKVAALWWLPRYAVAPLYPADGSEWLTGWLYTVNGRQMVLPVEDVIHLKLGHVDPLEERLHESELKAAVREVCTDNEAVGFHAALLKNSGVPSVAIIPTDPTIDLSPDQAEQLGRQFRGTFSGDGAGTAFVPSAPVKLEMIGYSPDKMAIEKMVRLTESRICACIGLAPDVVNLLSGQGSRTFANYSESRVAAYHDCLIPLQKQIAEALTNQLLPDLDPLAGARRVAWDYSAVQCLAEDEDAKVVRLNGQLLAGAIMRSEYRAAFNMQATPDDEVYYLPRGVTVVTGDHTTVVQTPDMTEEEDGDGGDGGTLVPDGAGPVPVDVQESEADAQKKSLAAEGDDGRPFDAARRLIAAARERAGSGDPKAILHALAEAGSEHLRALAEVGTKGLPDFFAAARGYLRDLFLAGAITLNGELTPAGRSALADAEAAQLAYLDKFERAAADGSQPPDGTFANRAAMYGSAAWAVAHAVEAAEMAGGKGKAEARRILDGAASHCPDCPAEAEKGWVPIAESVPIGATECGSLCRCSVAYR